MLSVKRFDPQVHDHRNFDCGHAGLNKFLQETASQHAAKGRSQTHVLTDQACAPAEILGYFCLSPETVDSAILPSRVAKSHGPTAPALLLGRLAIEATKQRSGLGTKLMGSVVQMARDALNIHGGIGLFVDAKDEQLAQFYEKFGFSRTAVGSLRLFLPAATLKQV